MKKYFYYKCFRRAFALAKSITRASKSSPLAASCSIEMVAKSDNLLSDIVVRKKVLISFSLLKLLSADATLIGVVKSIRRAIDKLG